MKWASEGGILSIISLEVFRLQKVVKQIFRLARLFLCAIGHAGWRTGFSFSSINKKKKSFSRDKTFQNTRNCFVAKRKPGKRRHESTVGGRLARDRMEEFDGVRTAAVACKTLR
jgi:hypothetical protein